MNDRVGAGAARPRRDRGGRLDPVRARSSAPSSAASARRSLDRLDSRHAAAGRAQRLHGDQAEQAEPDDDDALAERRLGAAHALDGDRADRGEGRVARGDASGTGATRLAGTDTTSAWFARPAPAQATRWPTWNAGDAAGVEHGARARVAERVCPGRPRRATSPIVSRTPCSRACLSVWRDEVRVLDRARGERAGAGRDDRALGAARDRRCRVGDEHRAGRRAQAPARRRPGSFHPAKQAVSRG